MAGMIPTTDHDPGPPPVYSDSGGFLIPVLLDGHRWIAIPPGDPIATYLVEEGGHGSG